MNGIGIHTHSHGAVEFKEDKPLFARVQYAVFRENIHPIWNPRDVISLGGTARVGDLPYHGLEFAFELLVINAGHLPPERVAVHKELPRSVYKPVASQVIYIVHFHPEDPVFDELIGDIGNDVDLIFATSDDGVNEFTCLGIIETYIVVVEKVSLDEQITSDWLGESNTDLISC